MFSKKDLFIMLFYCFDSLSESHNDEELNEFLSDANPFVFTDRCSADPSIYEEFDKAITQLSFIDFGYSNVKSFLEKHHPNLVKIFLETNEDNWQAAFKEYLNSKDN